MKFCSSFVAAAQILCIAENVNQVHYLNRIIFAVNSWEPKTGVNDNFRSASSAC